MAITRDDVTLMLQVEQTFGPSVEAKKFCWRDETSKLGADFFDKYGWDSDERFYVNAVATWCEIYGMLWKNKLMAEEMVMEWSPASHYWDQLKGILLGAREILADPELWINFEAVAIAQKERTA
ncbi:MAG: hypothetical protein ABR505_09845 [Actinomycetota bacterium]